MKLILFDIDGTLLVTRGAGREAKRQAMLEVFGAAGNVLTHPFGGKTDWQILAELLADQFSVTEIGARMASYEQILAQKLQNIIRDFDTTPCPNAIELIHQLRQHDDIVIGVLTGNTSMTAPVKLRAGGIDPEWFPIGAFGNEALSRNDLPKIALQRAIEYTGRPISPGHSIIVGDTPDDIRCARAIGAVAVAVKTGFAAPEDLIAAKPDYLLDNLTAFMDTVLPDLFITK